MKRPFSTFRSVLSAAALLFVLANCSHDPLDVSTDGVSVSIGYRNLDSLLVNTEKGQLQSALLQWHATIPEVIDYELGYCLSAGRVSDTGMVNHVYAFRNDAYIVRLEKRIASTFKDLPQRHQKIADGFRYLKAHFPDVKVPKNVVYMNSFFASSAFCTENDIAIGLDRYLGAKTDVIAELPNREFYEWIKEGMEPRYLERDAVAAWIMTHIVPEKDGQNTIEAIIRWGKILYLTEAAFPQAEKNLIIRYTPVDYEWALKNERAFWDHLVEHKLLFEKNEQDQSNFLKEGPFTPGLPEKGPDRLGQFLGWRIIQSYMEQYEVTLPELLQLPYTELLQEYEIK